MSKTTRFARGFAFASLALSAQAAQAGGTIDTFEVTSTADAQTAGTLRQAIADANGSAATDVRIDFDLPDGSEILLGSDLPVLSHPSVQIRNIEPANTIAIDGNAAHRLFQQIAPNPSISVTDLEMRNGRMTSSTAINGGACLYTQGRAILSRVRFIGCETTNGSGGAVHARNSLSAELSHFSGNRVFHDGTMGFRGGAIFCTGAFCNISDSTMIDNRVLTQLAGQNGRDGGAAAFSADENTIQNSHFVDNVGEGRGGALHVVMPQDNAFVQILDSLFRGNAAGEGGALFSQGFADDHTLVLDRNSFDRNTVTGRGPAAVINTTAQVSINGNVFSMNDSSNTAVAWGALYIFSNSNQPSEVTLDFNSFAGDDEQGYLFQAAEPDPSGVTVTRMHANVFDQRATSRSACREATGQVSAQSGRFNVVTDDSCTGSISDDSLIDTDPEVAEAILASRTLVYPTATSPTIDLVTSEALVICSSQADLDGTLRPLDGDNDGFAFCDAGAVERNIELFFDRFEN